MAHIICHIRCRLISSKSEQSILTFMQHIDRLISDTLDLAVGHRELVQGTQNINFQIEGIRNTIGMVN